MKPSINISTGKTKRINLEKKNNKNTKGNSGDRKLNLRNKPKIYFVNYDFDPNFDQEDFADKRNFYEQLNNNNGVTDVELDNSFGKTTCAADIAPKKRRYNQEGGVTYYV